MACRLLRFLREFPPVFLPPLRPKADPRSCSHAAKKVKRGRELAAIDHSKVKYEPFNKVFYRPPPEVEALTAEEVDEMRLEMDAIKVRGADPPKPVSKWSYCGLPAPW